MRPRSKNSDGLDVFDAKSRLCMSAYCPEERRAMCTRSCPGRVYPGLPRPNSVGAAGDFRPVDGPKAPPRRPRGLLWQQ